MKFSNLFTSVVNTVINTITAVAEKVMSYDYTFGNVTVTNSFKLNSQQESLMKQLVEFYHNENQQTFSLSGFAGTGKTSVINLFGKYVQAKGEVIAYSATTHVAVNVLARTLPGGSQVNTLHKYLQLSPNVKLEDFDPKNLSFEPGPNELPVDNFFVFVIDECSMMNDALVDFTKFKFPKAKIIFMGDHKQLKPVKQAEISASFKCDVNVQLTKVERTNRPDLLAFLLALRDGKVSKVLSSDSYHFTNDEKGMSGRMIQTFEKGLKSGNYLHTRMLCGTNKAVEKWNNYISSALCPTRTNPYFEKGEILLAYKTFIAMNVFNGGQYVVESVGSSDMYGCLTFTVKDLYTGLSTIIRVLDPDTSPEFLRDLESAKNDRKNWKEYRRLTENFILTKDVKSKKTGKFLAAKGIDLGYSITVHKSQGSTYDNVFLDIDSMSWAKSDDIENYFSMLYVACSRAREGFYALSKNAGSPMKVLNYSHRVLPVVNDDKDSISNGIDVPTTTTTEAKMATTDTTGLSSKELLTMVNPPKVLPKSKIESILNAFVSEYSSNIMEVLMMLFIAKIVGPRAELLDNLYYGVNNPDYKDEYEYLQELANTYSQDAFDKFMEYMDWRYWDTQFELYATTTQQYGEWVNNDTTIENRNKEGLSLYEVFMEAVVATANSLDAEQHSSVDILISALQAEMATTTICEVETAKEETSETAVIAEEPASLVETAKEVVEEEISFLETGKEYFATIYTTPTTYVEEEVVVPVVATVVAATTPTTLGTITLKYTTDLQLITVTKTVTTISSFPVGNDSTPDSEQPQEEETITEGVVDNSLETIIPETETNAADFPPWFENYEAFLASFKDNTVASVIPAIKAPTETVEALNSSVNTEVATPTNNVSNDVVVPVAVAVAETKVEVVAVVEEKVVVDTPVATPVAVTPVTVTAPVVAAVITEHKSLGTLAGYTVVKGISLFKKSNNLKEILASVSSLEIPKGILTIKPVKDNTSTMFEMRACKEAGTKNKKFIISNELLSEGLYDKVNANIHVPSFNLTTLSKQAQFALRVLLTMQATEKGFEKILQGINKGYKAFVGVVQMTKGDKTWLKCQVLDQVKSISPVGEGHTGLFVNPNLIEDTEFGQNVAEEDGTVKRLTFEAPNKLVAREIKLGASKVDGITNLGNRTIYLYDTALNANTPEFVKRMLVLGTAWVSPQEYRKLGSVRMVPVKAVTAPMPKAISALNEGEIFIGGNSHKSKLNGLVYKVLGLSHLEISKLTVEQVRKMLEPFKTTLTMVHHNRHYFLNVYKVDMKVKATNFYSLYSLRGYSSKFENEDGEEETVTTDIKGFFNDTLKFVSEAAATNSIFDLGSYLNENIKNKKVALKPRFVDVTSAEIQQIGISYGLEIAKSCIDSLMDERSVAKKDFLYRDFSNFVKIPAGKVKAIINGLFVGEIESTICTKVQYETLVKTFKHNFIINSGNLNFPFYGLPEKVDYEDDYVKDISSELRALLLFATSLRNVNTNWVVKYANHMTDLNQRNIKKIQVLSTSGAYLAAVSGFWLKPNQVYSLGDKVGKVTSAKLPIIFDKSVTSLENIIGSKTPYSKEELMEYKLHFKRVAFVSPEYFLEQENDGDGDLVKITAGMESLPLWNGQVEFTSKKREVYTQGEYDSLKLSLKKYDLMALTDFHSGNLATKIAKQNVAIMASNAYKTKEVMYRFLENGTDTEKLYARYITEAVSYVIQYEAMRAAKHDGAKSFYDFIKCNVHKAYDAEFCADFLSKEENSLAVKNARDFIEASGENTQNTTDFIIYALKWEQLLAEYFGLKGLDISVIYKLTNNLFACSYSNISPYSVEEFVDKNGFNANQVAFALMQNGHARQVNKLVGEFQFKRSEDLKVTNLAKEVITIGSISAPSYNSYVKGIIGSGVSYETSFTYFFKRLFEISATLPVEELPEVPVEEVLSSKGSTKSSKPTSCVDFDSCGKSASVDDYMSYYGGKR